MTRWLRNILVLSICVIVIYDSPLYDLPEFWAGAGRTMDTFYDLALSYAMSYVFFLLIFIPDRRNKRFMKNIYITYVREIIRLATQLQEELTKAIPTGDAITNLKLLRGNLNSPISVQWNDLLPQSTNWSTFLGIQAGRMQEAYNNISPYMLFVEPELISKVSRVVDGDFCQIVRNNLVSNFIGDSTLEILTDPAKELFSANEDLANYIQYETELKGQQKWISRTASLYR